MTVVPEETWKTPRQGRLKGGPGFIPLDFSVHNSFPINDWRIALFRHATSGALTYPPTLEESDLLITGIIQAAHSANRVELEESVKVFSPPMKAVYNLLGAERFQELYTQTPPEELIEYMIEGGYRGDLQYWPDTPKGDEAFRVHRLDEITALVINGHLAWRDRFTEVGVPTPVEYMAKLEVQHTENLQRLGSLAL